MVTRDVVAGVRRRLDCRDLMSGRTGGSDVAAGRDVIKVMIIDDSAVIRAQYGGILAAEADMDVVAVAEDPYVARRLLDQVHPDVITLDVEMPRMDGITFLRKLMAGRPTPVVMASTLTQKGAETSLEALRIGAVGIVGKPTPDHPCTLEDFAVDLVNQVRAAAHARVGCHRPVMPQGPRLELPYHPTGQRALCPVLIGASTGGTEALHSLLSRLPQDATPMAIVQHMPPGFTASFAQRLDRICGPHIHEAREGDRLVAGQVLIAPGGIHMEVTGSRAHPRVHLLAAERVNRHRPSVDVLFHSAAKVLGDHAVGVLLTGMGKDGAAGMKAMFDAGAFTIAQDKESSVVYGMPHAAKELGAVSRQLSLDRVPHMLLKAAAAGERLAIA
jgi:two-component system chemotaxis response regulator CheB